jgi:hypothetical protein
MSKKKVKMVLELEKEIDLKDGQELEQVIREEALTLLDEGIYGWTVIDDEWEVIG